MKLIFLQLLFFDVSQRLNKRESRCLHVQNEVRRLGNKEERRPSRSVVPLRWWHHTKSLFNQHLSLLLRSPHIKTTAMTGILLMGASGKHHKVIESKATLCPNNMDLILWNKDPLRCDVNTDAKMREKLFNMWVYWAARDAATQTTCWGDLFW